MTCNIIICNVGMSNVEICNIGISNIRISRIGICNLDISNIGISSIETSKTRRFNIGMSNMTLPLAPVLLEAVKLKVCKAVRL